MKKSKFLHLFQVPLPILNLRLEPNITGSSTGDSTARPKAADGVTSPVKLKLSSGSRSWESSPNPPRFIPSPKGS